MVEEVGTIHDTIEQLNAKLAEAQEAKGELLSIEKNLQNDIGVKNNSLRIDKHKCLGIRYVSFGSFLVNHQSLEWFSAI